MNPLTVETHDIRNSLSEVERANEELRALWLRAGLPEDMEVPVTMCLEEVLSNVIRHGCTGRQDCLIQVVYRVLPGGIEIEVSDDGKPFDPLTLPPPNLNVPLEQRRAGGLGVFLVRQMMDEVRYAFQNGRNHLTFLKLWSAPGA
jgi:anti-sigma regulatory factor (Ser/Thr protein kinase)